MQTVEKKYLQHPISAKTTADRCSPTFETLSTDWLQK